MQGNPDGYYQIYANGQCSRYKNTDNDDGCANPLNWGVDLDRNYPLDWNSGGTGSHPCDSAYPALSAPSEQESQHVSIGLQTVTIASFTSSAPRRLRRCDSFLKRPFWCHAAHLPVIYEKSSHAGCLSLSRSE
jgi:hypothetical protein